MPRRPFFCVPLLLTAGTAAATSECPPGDWFCEPIPVPASPPGQRPPSLPPPPPAEPEPWEPSRPPIDLRVPPPPPPGHRPRPRIWAVRTHLLVPFVDSGAASNYAMAGLGFGGRARPDPAVALDLSFDSMGGVDYVGHRRTELALDFATTVYFNPRDPFQGFILAGLGWSRADVSYKVHEAVAAGTIKRQIDQTYYYFGLLAGLGLEWRFERRWSTDLALLGVLRGRTDSNADENPEFVDPTTKLATNSSGFGLLRLGLNYYF
jgi:hypothetical protein